MSEAPAPVARGRLRTWCILGAAFLGVLLACAAGIWLYLRSDGDLRAFEQEASALGIDLHPIAPKVTDPVRVAAARRIEVLTKGINLVSPGIYYDWRSGKPPSEEFRLFHQGISSQAVRDVAGEIVSLGSDPFILQPGTRWVDYGSWGDLMVNRLLIAETEELDACLSAQQVIVEMTLRDQGNWWRWWREVDRYCVAVRFRLPDQRERLRPAAVWLDGIAVGILRDFPLNLGKSLVHDFRTIPCGEQICRELGVMLPGIFHIQFPPILEAAFRLERGNILRSELEWLQYVKAHPSQVGDWLAESGRRQALLTSKGSWLTVPLHEAVLHRQNPSHVRSMKTIVDRAQSLADELRQVP